jgi:hypothetical protein
VQGEAHRTHNRRSSMGPSPRCAGSSHGATSTSGLGRDHPRGCGRAEPPDRAGCARPGPIPAGARSREGSHVRRAARRDHPCRRGEQSSVMTSTVPGRGPSPRARGAARHDAHRLGVIRVHPRGCGEQAWPAEATSSVRGPSPRVRGSSGATGWPARARRTAEQFVSGEPGRVLIRKRSRYMARATARRVRTLAHWTACASASADERVRARPLA